MLINEAVVLATALDRIRPLGILDIGSGNRAVREIVQPHIAAAYHGHSVVWTDADEWPGTYRLDISTGECEGGFDPHGFGMVTAMSVLEHVEDIDKSVAFLRNLTHDWLIVSVPRVYPPHGCPIDNGWRPDTEELSSRFSGDGLVVHGAYETVPERFGDVPAASATIVVAKRA